MFCFCPKGNRTEERSGCRDERHNRGQSSRVSTFMFICCRSRGNVTPLHVSRSFILFIHTALNISGRTLFLKQKLFTFTFTNTSASVFLSLCQQRLHFSDCGPQPHKNTPQRHPSDQFESFSTPLAAFPWERDDTRPATRRQSPISPQMPCADVIGQAKAEPGNYGKGKGSREETDGE